MNKWRKAAENIRAQSNRTEFIPRLTMELRQVIDIDGKLHIEQRVEYKDKQDRVLHSEWVELPTIYEG